jgi:DNA-binding response OmpR family regulator
MTPRVLVAHERREVSRTIAWVLVRSGFAVDVVSTGRAALETIARRQHDALVVDVAMPDVPGYEVAARAKTDAHVRAVVLVASVYRKTSYKRRPTQLYGADDYVELHHVGDQLPRKLRQHLGLDAQAPSAEVEDAARQALLAEGDERLAAEDVEKLAALVVADVVLYNGDALQDASDLASAHAAVAADLEAARDLVRQVAGGVAAADPVDAAFDRLMHVLGRGGAR